MARAPRPLASKSKFSISVPLYQINAVRLCSISGHKLTQQLICKRFWIFISITLLCVFVCPPGVWSIECCKTGRNDWHQASQRCEFTTIAVTRSHASTVCVIDSRWAEIKQLLWGNSLALLLGSCVCVYWGVGVKRREPCYFSTQRISGNSLSRWTLPPWGILKANIYWKDSAITFSTPYHFHLLFVPVFALVQETDHSVCRVYGIHCILTLTGTCAQSACSASQ